VTLVTAVLNFKTLSRAGCSLSVTNVTNVTLKNALSELWLKKRFF
jgi:hypothetical protein